LSCFFFLDFLGPQGGPGIPLQPGGGFLGLAAKAIADGPGLLLLIPGIAEATGSRPGATPRLTYAPTAARHVG